MIENGWTTSSSTAQETAALARDRVSHPPTIGAMYGDSPKTSYKTVPFKGSLSAASGFAVGSDGTEESPTGLHDPTALPSGSDKRAPSPTSESGPLQVLGWRRRMTISPRKRLADQERVLRSLATDLGDE